MKFKLMILIALILHAVTASNAFAGYCGPLPNPPPTPPGASRCIPVCKCDKSDKNCYWVFHCS